MRGAWLFLIVAPVLAGCGMTGERKPVGEFCADLVIQALPGEVEITHKNTASVGIAQITASVEATRKDVAPTAAVARDVAAECKFDHDVLVDFHWTKAPIR